MIIETIPAIQALTGEQKLLLAGELWRDASEDSEPVSPEIAAHLDERIEAYRKHPEEVFTTEQVTEHIRKLKERLAAQSK